MIYRLTILLILTISISVVAIGQTTELTYQGQLQSSSMPASGSFDFEFALYDAVAGGSQIGSTLTRSGVAVSNGIFSVNLDFGSSFPGAGRFLEVRVRQAGGGAFAELTPRQPVSSAPYSVKSLNAESATSATNFTGNLTGDVTGTQAATTVSRLQGRNVASTPPLNGQVLKYNSVNNQWEPDTDNTGSGGGGTITGVTPGTGLTGGGATGNVTLAIANGGVGTAQLADGAVTDAKITNVSGAKVTGAVTNSTQLGGIAANQYVQTTDSRMTDARNPLPGSANYIQNQNAGQQSSSNFSISGNGTAAGTLSGSTVNAATQFNLGGNRVFGSFFGSTFLGIDAGFTGSSNSFFGVQAGQAILPQGGANSFFGHFAGRSNTDGDDNSFFGSDAGDSNTTGRQNSYFGRSAGISSTEADMNSYFGRSAGLLTTTGSENTFIGANSGLSNTTGSNNTLLGSLTSIGQSVLFGTAIGSGAVVTQNNTVVLGRPADAVSVPGTMTVTGALTANGSGLTNLNASNITTGTLAVIRGGTGLATSGAAGNFLRSNGPAWISSPLQAADVPTGSGNYIQNSAATQASSNFNISGTGSASTFNATSQYNISNQRVLSHAGTNNLFVGVNAGTANTGGSFNAFFGGVAGQANTDGGDNAIFGASAGRSNTIGSFNAFFGTRAGEFSTGFSNSFFGTNAGNGNTTGLRNTIIGAGADVTSNNLTNATAIGYLAGVSQSNSLVLGSTFGVNGAIDDTKVGIGTPAPGAKLHIAANGGQIMIGDANCSAGVASIGFGTTLECTNYALSGSTTNTFINRSTGGAILFRENNVDQVRIAAGGNVGIGTNSPDDKLDVDGDIRIGTSGINGCLRRNDGSALTGICSSDMRFKRNITPFGSVLSKVSQLRPVHYYWRATDFPTKRFGDLQSYGLIAQEVEQVLPELVSTDAAGFKQIDYSKLPLVTIQAVKELKAENDTLKAENTAMQQMLIKMDARLKSVEKSIKANGRARR